MDALDFFYNEFINFCKEKDIEDTYSKLIFDRYKYKLPNKAFILSNLNDNIFNHTLCWAETNEGSEFWRNIHCKWEEYWDISIKKLKKIKKSLDATVFKYCSNEDLDYIDFPLLKTHYYADENWHILTYASKEIFNYIQEYKVPIKLTKIDVDKDLLHVSDGLYDLLSTFKSEQLLLRNLSSLQKINYLNIEPNGKVSYLPIDKTLRKDFNPSQAYFDKNRKVTTIGRVLRKFDNWKEFTTDKNIEKLSNYFSTIFSDLTIEIWEPSQIKDAYLEKNYGPRIGSITSTLYNSCMRYPTCQEYFEFYEAAGTKIAVALNKNRKVIGRALLWKIKNSLYFLDRIYTNNPAQCIRIAQEVRKLVPIKYYKVDAYFYSIESNEVVSTLSYSISRKKLINYSGKFPYLDSFYVFDSSKGTLKIPGKMYYLHSTSGSLSTI